MPFLYEFAIDNEKVEGQIGFSTSRKWEEALDEATLVIPFTYENDTPYKIFSMLNIEITEIDNYTDKTTIETREYEFIVYSDNVESLGSYGYYRHQVNAIEYTAKLDYYMINNLSKSRSVLKDTQAPFKVDNIPITPVDHWSAKITLENIDIKENFYSNKDIEFDKVYQAYVAYGVDPTDYKRTNAVIRTNATLVSGSSPHVLSIVGTTWVFPEGEWEIEYGFIADGTEGYGYDIGFNAIYTFYVEAIEKYESSMYDVINEIRDSVSKYGGIEDTVYYDYTRIFDIDSAYDDYLKSVPAPQIYMAQATARQMLIYALSFVNMLPFLETGVGIDTLKFEEYNLSNGAFVLQDVVAFGGKQNTNQIGTRNYQPISQALANNLDDTSVYSPSRSGYQQVRSLDIQLTADNFTIKLPENAPLYMPKKLVVIVPEIIVYSQATPTETLLTLTDFELDLTPRWINEEEWKLKEITNNFPTITSRDMWEEELGLRSYKVENLSWQVGDTHINISTVFGTLFEGNLIHNVVKMAVYEYIMLNPPLPILADGSFFANMSISIDIPTASEYKDWRFRVEYITDERLVIKQEKEDLTQVSFYSEMRQNQEQALVNIVRQSRKGYGDLQRTGNQSFSFSKKHTSLDDFYEVGQKGSDNYTITQIDTQWFNDYAIATYGITKYHNRIQQATFVNQKYRPFDNFAKSVLNRHEHYGDYLIALPPDDTESGVQTQDTKIYKNDTTVRQIVSILLGNDFGLPTKPSATIALIRTDGLLNANPETGGGNRNFIVSPVTSRGIKGGFAFTLGFKNNQIAGDGLVSETVGATTTYYNQAVRYTDKKGRFTRFGFAIMKDLEFDSADDLTYPLIEKNISTFPPTFQSNVYFTCGNYYQNEPFEHPLVWNKDPMTNAQLTYQLNVVSYYIGLYVFGLKFFTENYIVKEHDILNGAKLYLYSDSTVHEMFEDLFVKSGYYNTISLRDNGIYGDGNVEYDHITNTIEFIGISLTIATSWAIGIINDNGDIELLLACNEGLNGIKFVNRHFRPNVKEIGNITLIQEFLAIDFTMELSGEFVYVRGNELLATMDIEMGLTIDLEYYVDDSVPLAIDLGLVLTSDIVYEIGTSLAVSMDLGTILTNTLTYVRGGEVDLTIDLGLVFTNDLVYRASNNAGATVDLGMTFSPTLTYFIGDSIQKDIDYGMVFSSDIAFVKDIELTTDLGLTLTNDITFVKDTELTIDLGIVFSGDFVFTHDEELPVNLSLLLSNDIQYHASKDIGAIIDFALETAFDIQFGRSTELFETMDISMSLSFDIQYTKYEPQYASPTIEVASGNLGNDAGGDYWYIIYRVKNNDADSGRVGSYVFTGTPTSIPVNMKTLATNTWSDYMEFLEYYTSGTPKLYAQTRDVSGEDDKGLSDIVMWDSW